MAEYFDWLFDVGPYIYLYNLNHFFVFCILFFILSFPTYIQMMRSLLSPAASSLSCRRFFCVERKKISCLIIRWYQRHVTIPSTFSPSVILTFSSSIDVFFNFKFLKFFFDILNFRFHHIVGLLTGRAISFLFVDTHQVGAAKKRIDCVGPMDLVTRRQEAPVTRLFPAVHKILIFFSSLFLKEKKNNLIIIIIKNPVPPPKRELLPNLIPSFDSIEICYYVK